MLFVLGFPFCDCLIPDPKFHLLPLRFDKVVTTLTNPSCEIYIYKKTVKKINFN